MSKPALEKFVAELRALHAERRTLVHNDHDTVRLMVIERRLSDVAGAAADMLERVRRGLPHVENKGDALDIADYLNALAAAVLEPKT